MVVVSPLICKHFISHESARIPSKVTVFNLNAKRLTIWNSFLRFGIIIFFSTFFFRLPQKQPFLLYSDVHFFHRYHIIPIVYKNDCPNTLSESTHVWSYSNSTKWWQERWSSSKHSTKHSKSAHNSQSNARLKHKHGKEMSVYWIRCTMQKLSVFYLVRHDGQPTIRRIVPHPQRVQMGHVGAHLFIEFTWNS